MKWIRFTVYLVMSVLFFEVTKSAVGKFSFTLSYFTVMIIGCIEVLFFLGTIFVFVFLQVLRKYYSVKKVIGVLIGLFVFFVVIAETLFTHWLHHPERMPGFLTVPFKYYYDRYNVRLPQFERSMSVYNQNLFYTLHPDTAFNFENAEFNNRFRTNSLGMRDDFASTVRPDIICLGDSYTMGWGVDQDAAYPKQLQALSGLKVLNAGISSYGTAREMVQLRGLDTTNLKYLIIQYCGNDAEENEACRKNNFVLNVSSREKYDSLQKGYRYSRQYFPGRHFLIIFQLFAKMQLNKLYPFFKVGYGHYVPVGTKQKQATLFLDILTRSGINFGKTKIILIQMDDYNYNKSDFLEQVDRLLQQQPYKNQLQDALRVLNIAPMLTQEDYYNLDIHLRQPGQHKVAVALWSVIR